MGPPPPKEDWRQIIRGILLAVIVLFIFVGFASALGPFVAHWLQCQQLSPAERFFTRGC